MWLFRDKEFTSADIPPEATGFVYVVTNPEGKKYIGKKLFFRTITKKPLKGQTRKRKAVVESDWKTYAGSSEIVKAQVKERGLDAFKREILAISFSKGMLSLTELQEQLKHNVLFDEQYLNGIINVRINKSHVFNTRTNIN